VTRETLCIVARGSTDPTSDIKEPVTSLNRHRVAQFDARRKASGVEVIKRCQGLDRQYVPIHAGGRQRRQNAIKNASIAPLS